MMNVVTDLKIRKHFQTSYLGGKHVYVGMILILFRLWMLDMANLRYASFPVKMLLDCVLSDRSILSNTTSVCHSKEALIPTTTLSKEP